MAESRVDIEINRDWCKCCYLCIAVCPLNVYTCSDYVGEKGVAIPLASNPEKCVQYSLCEMMCPDMAITVHAKENGRVCAAN